MLIQLPNDSVSVGYRKTGEFEFSQVFQSKQAGSTGTELEFVKAGIGYAYIEIDKHTRRVLPV